MHEIGRRNVSIAAFWGGLIGWLILAGMACVASGDEVTPIALEQIDYRSNDITQRAVDDQATYPEVDRPFITYLIADTPTAQLLCWVISSTSPQPVIENCQPDLVAPGLYKIDIRQLGWDFEDYKQVLTEAHPYGGFSLLVRGDWLVCELLDTKTSAERANDGIAAHYRLLYGTANVPKTESQFLEFWEVDATKERRRGMVKDNSLVNKQGRRWVERRKSLNGDVYITRDSKRLTTLTDPLEKPAGDFTFDGSELIVPVVKHLAASQEEGIVQYYLLADGAGNVVNAAPVDLVEDYNRFRDRAEITMFGSCMKCHQQGLQVLGTNAIAELATKYGIAIFDADPQELMRFHFAKLDPALQRTREDYVRGVFLHTGWTPEQLVEAIETIVRGYDAPLSLERAASELGVTPEGLKAKIEAHGKVPAGIARLARGSLCVRGVFEEQFGFLDAILRN